MSPKKPDQEGSKAWLGGAYDLSTPEDNRIYYKEFAKAYDAEFASALGYCYPRIIAQMYLGEAKPDDGPIADIGCGTGLVAEALGSDQFIDGFDISPEMLVKASEKALYRRLFEVDITSDLTPYQHQYGAVVSAGTFTHGHLGPSPLKGLLTIAKPGCLFVIGVNKTHFEGLGFEVVLRDLVQKGLILEPRLKEARIYDKDGHDHAQDKALVLIFKTPRDQE